MFSRRVLVALALSMLAAAATAQQYPTRPIRVIVGYGPGGVTDVIARIFADEFSKRLGQPAVVENRPGASALIAATAVKNAAPDGHMLFAGSSTPFSPIFLKENPIVASRDMAPVAMLGQGDWFMYAPANLPIRNLSELAAWAKANPGQLRFSSPAVVNTMLFSVAAKRLGAEFESISYKTSDQTITAMLGGDGQVTLNSVSGFQQFVQGGKLRMIATLSPQRSSQFPDVPTATEQGVPMSNSLSFGLWTTQGTPRAAIMKLNATVLEAGTSAAVQERVRNIALVTSRMSPEEVGKLHDSDTQVLSEAAVIGGFKPQ